jgi:YidC/Oxa1 family membrane protein insertase
MNFFVLIFNTIFYRPLFNILILIYQYFSFHDLGITIILFTILIRVLFSPLTYKSIKAQKTFQELQPKIKEIQKKFKDDQQKQAQEIMKLYKEANFNPFSGCLPLLIQLPILIALYQILQRGLVPGEMANLYFFVSNPGKIEPTFLGIINLERAYFELALLAGFLQLLQVKFTTPKPSKLSISDKMEKFSAIFQKQSLFIFPLLTFLVLVKLPSAIGLYWIVSTLFTITQQYFIFKKLK